MWAETSCFLRRTFCTHREVNSGGYGSTGGVGYRHGYWLTLVQKGKVVKKFEKIAPEFVSWLEDNLDEGLTVFDFPRSWWRRIRTINGLERLHREIRRRTRVVGIFPHEASALRLISAVLAEIHEEWLTDRQYLKAGWKKQVEQFFPTERKLQKNGCLTGQQAADDQGRTSGTNEEGQ